MNKKDFQYLQNTSFWSALFIGMIVGVMVVSVSIWIFNVDDRMNFADNTEQVEQVSQKERYLNAGFKEATTSVFWVGESATAENDYIDNRASAFDETWQESFGGVDDPSDRCGYQPCDFTPKQNPFYFALPYTDLEAQTGIRKDSAKNIPWYDAETLVQYQSIVENRWIEVRHDEQTCYAQWKDVGPNESDDFAYVFGETQTPKNDFGLSAGLDISPAMRDCLNSNGSEKTFWKFVEEKDVPEGPWKEISANEQS